MTGQTVKYIPVHVSEINMRKSMRFSDAFGELKVYILYRICKATGILRYSDQNEGL